MSEIFGSMLLSVMEVSIHKVKEEMEAGTRITLLDVREDDELENGVIPGSIHIPMGSIPERLGELDPESKIIVICRTGNRSRKITQYLQNHGFADVLNMSEGMNGWASEIDLTCKVY